MPQIDHILKIYETRLSLARQLVAHLNADPEFRHDLLKLLNTDSFVGRSPLGPRRRLSRAPTPLTRRHFEAIAQHLLNADNRPRTVRELIAATGLPRSAVAEVIYRSHKGRFEKLPNPKGGRAKLWRLTTDSSPQHASLENSP